MKNEIKLFEKARNGCEESILTIIEDHMKYVEMMTKKYCTYGVIYHELYSICKERLIQCIFTHDPTKGEFKSYIFSHLKKVATDAIRKQRQVHVPAQSWKKHKIECVSINAEFDHEDNTSSSISNSASKEDIVGDIIRKEQYELFIEVFDELTQKEKFVIRAKNLMWFDYEDCRKKVQKSFKELGRYIDCTQMGVKVVYTRAIEKMQDKIKEIENDQKL